MESGVSHHARGRVVLRDLEKLGVACAVLAANRSWTTFAQLDMRLLDGGAIARVLDVAIVQVWSDEDHGTTVAFFDVDGWRAELPIELGGDGNLSTIDRTLFAELVRRELVPKDRADALARQIATKASERDPWLARGGVEEILDFPDATRLPLPCSPSLLARLAPHAQLAGHRLARGTSGRPNATRRRATAQPESTTRTSPTTMRPTTTSPTTTSPVPAESSAMDESLEPERLAPWQRPPRGSS